MCKSIEVDQQWSMYVLNNSHRNLKAKRVFIGLIQPLHSKGKDDALYQMLGWEEGKVVRYLNTGKLYTLHKTGKLYTSYLEIKFKLPATIKAELTQSQNTMDRKIISKPKVTGTQSQAHPLTTDKQWNRKRQQILPFSIRILHICGHIPQT